MTTRNVSGVFTPSTPTAGVGCKFAWLWLTALVTACLLGFPPCCLQLIKPQIPVVSLLDMFKYGAVDIPLERLQNTMLVDFFTGGFQDITGVPVFILLDRYLKGVSPIYKLCLGPRSIVVISDAIAAKAILKSQVGVYDKGVRQFPVILLRFGSPLLHFGTFRHDPAPHVAVVCRCHVCFFHLQSIFLCLFVTHAPRETRATGCF